MINEKEEKDSDLLVLIPTVASYYGAYTRLYTLVFLEQYVTIFEEKIDSVSQGGELSENDKDSVKEMKRFLEEFCKVLLEENIKGKLTDVVMPYSEPHRKKVHVSQAVCIIMRAFTRSKESSD